MRYRNLLMWLAVISLLVVAPALRGGGKLLLAQQPSEGETEAAPTAAELGAPGVKIGVVDFEMVQGGWSVVEELQARKDFARVDAPRMLQIELGYRQRLLCLTEDEVEEAVALWKKQRERAASESETKRLDALEQEADQRARRYQELVQKDPLSEDEKREYSFLTEIRNGRRDQLAQLQQSFQQDLTALDERYQAADRRALDELRKAAQRVGEQRGLDYIFTREALLFGGIDISQDVIDDLQANVPTLDALAPAAAGPEGEGATAP